MRERPILFNTEMVKALLDGRKTQTRRTTNLDVINQSPDIYKYKGPLKSDPNKHILARMWRNTHVETTHIRCPYGKPGDLLWVRETWEKAPSQTASVYSNESKVVQKIFYKASKEYSFMKWSPSIFMPKDAARIWLQVKEVKVERLQDISKGDAIAEGVFKYGPFGEYAGSKHPNGGSMKYRAYGSPVDAFRCIWESINGPDSWQENPWVWVLEFEVLSTTSRAAAYTKLEKEVTK